MKEIIPQDIAIDLAITVNLFAEMYNCNDPILEENNIDWWYLHKLNRRAQHHLNKAINANKSEEGI
jgi:hypothetical protein